MASPPGDLSEGDCLALARNGNRAAQDEVIRRHMPAVFHLSLKLLGNRDAAADATQEAFLRAFGAIGTFDTGRSFRAWVSAIAWNLIRDEFRRGRWREKSGDASELPDRKQPAPHDALERRERSEWVNEALRQVDEPLRALLVLRDMEGLSYMELAEILGVRLGTVKSRVHRARMELKKVLVMLRPQWFEESSK